MIRRARAANGLRLKYVSVTQEVRLLYYIIGSCLAIAVSEDIAYLRNISFWLRR